MSSAIRRASGDFARRLSGFTLNTTLMVAVPFVTFPVTVLTVGPTVWAQAALGQAVGSFSGILVAFGWAITGPVQVARSRHPEQVAHYIESLNARTVLLPAGLLISLVATAQLASSHRIVAALSAAIYVMNGLSAVWFFTGTGDSRRMLICDTAPRVSSAMIGVPLMVWTDSVQALLASQLAGALTAVYLSSRAIAGGSPLYTGPQLRATLRILRAQRNGVGVALIAGGYSAAPTMIVSAVKPSALPAFAAVDKVTRLVLAVAAPFNQVLQGVVPQRDRAALTSRLVAGLAATALFALVVSLAVWVSLPTVIEILSGGRISMQRSVAPLIAGTVLCVLLSRYTGLIWLMVRGMHRHLLASTILGAVVGLPLLVLLSVEKGAVGAWISILVTESLVLAYQSGVLIRSAFRSGPVD